MKKIILIFSILLISSLAAFGQKGVDTQTKKITEKTGTNDNSNVSRSITFGKDKTKTRSLLANPYKLASRRDVLIENILLVLEEKKLIVDEASSRVKEGLIVTQPVIFAKGPIATKTELNRYANLPSSDAVWRSGRFSLRIEIESIDGMNQNVIVLAKVEGKSETSFISEWTAVPTSGIAEDEFLAKLVEMVTGKPVEEKIIKN